MKSVFTRFRISSALDDQEPLSPRMRRAIDASDDLRSFEADAARLGRLLRTSVPGGEIPSDLHRSIIHAVRASARPSRFVWPAWAFKLAAPALALVLGVVLCMYPQPPVSVVPRAALATPQSLTAGPAALALGEQVTVDGPAAMLAPLSDELERLNQDVQRAATAFLAALP